MSEVFKTYSGQDVAVSQCVLALEVFVGDVDGKTIATETGDNTFIDEGTVDADEAVIATNGLIFALEQREAAIERLTAENAELLASLKCVVAMSDRATVEYARAHAIIAKAEGRTLPSQKQTAE